MDNKKTKKDKKKTGSKLLKIVILVVVLTLVAVGGIIASDVLFSDNDTSNLSDTVTVTVSGTEIFLNGSEKISLVGLENYLTERFDKKDYCTVALINDTQNPADIDTYNSVVEILGEFGIKQEPLTLPATNDELKLASIDEH